MPGTELLLSPALSRGKLPYTVLACRKDGRQVLLHTHLTNRVIRRLIDDDRLECFKDYRVVKAEPACGRHRFDLLLENQSSGESYYLEIKSCTLFAGRMAMFPDATTKRGSNHLCKLNDLSASGIKTGCLFVVMNPEVKYFLPAYHIDYHFARVFREVKNTVELNAVAIGFDHSFSTVNVTNKVAIPFDLLNSELEDRGSYLLLITMNSVKTLTVGSLGQIPFKQGYYIYVGSAMRNLSKRVARHTRKKKQQRWHIDYLTAEAAAVTPVPIICSDRLECELAVGLQKIAAHPIKGFGSSDCSCPGHLFYFTETPLQNPRFIDLIQHYRIRRLEEKLDLQ